MEIKMNESSSFYANNATDDEKARKTLTLKSARTIDGPETLIDPQIKRKLKIVGQQLKRQKIVGITGMILVGALLCCYIPYDIVYLRYGYLMAEEIAYMLMQKRNFLEFEIS